jgi:hypothetical protein
MDPSALQSLTAEQKQAVMAQAQGQANQQIMAAMIENMTAACFDKCTGTSVSYSVIELQINSCSWLSCQNPYFASRFKQ